MRTFFESAGMLAATTIGAGVFALPYLFVKSGWLIGVLYLFLFGSIMLWAHWLYLRTLGVARGNKRLLALAKEEGSRWFSLFSACVIVGGLVLSLVVYLVLGMVFLTLLFPSLESGVALILFWIAGTVPIAISVRRVVSIELLGALLLVGIIAGLFFYGMSGVGDFFKGPAFVPEYLLLPFGAVLFSLAGWTALEPMHERCCGAPSPQKSLVSSLWFGTAVIVGSYLLFIGGIMGSEAPMTPDTLSGFMKVAPAVARLLAFFGLIALWTSYVPIGREAKNALQEDMQWKYAFLFVAIAPPLLVMLGVDTFVEAISIAGGVFVALQYVLILFVAQRKLSLSMPARFLVRGVSALFLLAAVYEVFVFFTS